MGGVTPLLLRCTAVPIHHCPKVHVEGPARLAGTMATLPGYAIGLCAEASWPFWKVPKSTSQSRVCFEKLTTDLA